MSFRLGFISAIGFDPDAELYAYDAPTVVAHSVPAFVHAFITSNSNITFLRKTPKNRRGVGGGRIVTNTGELVLRNPRLQGLHLICLNSG